MKVRILVDTMLNGRFLLPGYELDSKLMPLYTRDQLVQLVEDGRAERIIKHPEKKPEVAPNDTGL